MEEVITCIYGHECSFTPSVDSEKCQTCLMYRKMSRLQSSNQLGDETKKGYITIPQK